MRMAIPRMTQLSKACSKKLGNHRAAVAFHFAHYNLVRRHQALRVTPAMAAGVVTEIVGQGTTARRRVLTPEVA
jgi:hypothetical protein